MAILDEIITNAGFEDASLDGRPGEALGWTWEHYSGQFGGDPIFADFNTESGLEAYLSSTEDFEAGFPAEFGTVVGYNNEWLSSFSDIQNSFAQFNVGAGDEFSGTVESFDVWGADGFSWGASIYGSGPPWLESYVETFAEFTGWYGTIETDSFEESWDSDPLTTESGYQWVPGNNHNGCLRGSPLTFPIVITPDNRDLTVYDKQDDELYRLEITVGEYSDITSLVLMLNTVWNAEASSSLVGFSAFSDSDSGVDALLWGWDGGVSGDADVFLGVIEKWSSNDARPALGLDNLAPAGGYAGLRMPASNAATKPGDITDDDTVILDSWSYIAFSVIDPPDVAAFPHMYRTVFAEFDTDLSMSNYIEIMRLDGWFGSGATWIEDISDPGVTVTLALFDGASDTENFEANWDDELY